MSNLDQGRGLTTLCTELRGSGEHEAADRLERQAEQIASLMDVLKDVYRTTSEEPIGPRAKVKEWALARSQAKKMLGNYLPESDR